MSALPTLSSRQMGIGFTTALVVLVVIAALVAAVARLSATQQSTATLDLEMAEAWQAAGAGISYGIGRIVRGDWQACFNSQTSLTLENGFTVTVRCASSLFTEGEITPGTTRQVRLYQLTSTACNQPAAGACPNNDAATGPFYVERVREWSGTLQMN